MIHPYFNLSGSDARGLLYGLLEVDKIQLRENPQMPSMRQLVQDGSVVYRRADPEEHWQSYGEIVEAVESNGVAYADCEDIATAMAAEDQVRHKVLSLPYAYAPREGLFHVVTAVPKGQFGGIPEHQWPAAQYAPEVVGYVLQDPSVAAGMGKFGGLPRKELSTMSEYGAARQRSRYGAARQRSRYGRDKLSQRRRRQGRGLGGLLGSFQEGLLGNVRGTDIARKLGAGAREGAGIEDDWASQIGQSLPGRLGLGAGASDGQGEADAIASLRKGARAEARDAEFDEADEDFDEFDEFDEEFDEEFGYGYGRAEPRQRRRRERGRGLGGFFKSFSEGLLGNVKGTDIARKLGAGAREGAGIKEDWATQLGQSLPGRVGLGSAESQGEADAIESLRKGSQTEARKGKIQDEEGFDDFDAELDELEADLDEDEYGRMWFADDFKAEEMGFVPEDYVGSDAWHMNNMTNRVVDDMFGAVDDDVYRIGIFPDSVTETVDDLHESVQPRGRGGSFYDRPLATFGNLGDGEY